MVGVVVVVVVAEVHGVVVVLLFLCLPYMYPIARLFVPACERMAK